jgi:hypothetical protein
MLDRILLHVRRQAVGYLALLIALSGTAYAATTVGSKDLAPIKLRARGLNIDAGKAAIVSKKCKQGERALSVGTFWGEQQGGASTTGELLQAEASLTSPDRGTATGRNRSTVRQQFAVQVACLKKA